MSKLEEAIEEANIPAKERILTEPPEYANEKRLEEKKNRSKVKQTRNWKSERY